jgi:hypothetical protein
VNAANEVGEVLAALVFGVVEVVGEIHQYVITLVPIFPVIQNAAVCEYVQPLAINFKLLRD